MFLWPRTKLLNYYDQEKVNWLKVGSYQSVHKASYDWDFSDCKEIGEISFTVNDLKKVSYIFVDFKSSFIRDGCLLERGLYYKALRIRKTSLHLLFKLLRQHTLSLKCTKTTCPLKINQTCLIDMTYTF